MRKYRSRHQIYKEILEACSSEAGINRTRIMYACEISFFQLKSYLDTILDKGLIRMNSDSYYLTDKGREALTVLNELGDLLGP